MIEKVFLAFGLVLVLEGVLYALFPSYLRNMVRQINTLSDSDLRIGGLVALIAGVGLIWFLE